MCPSATDNDDFTSSSMPSDKANRGPERFGTNTNIR